MRLLTKTTLNLLSISLFIYLFGVIVFYYSLRIQVDRNVNNEMEKRKNSIVRQMEEAHSSVSQPPNRNEMVIVTPVDKAIPHDRYADTLIYNKEEQRYQLFRQLGFSETVNKQPYYIQIYKSLEETDSLIVSIIMTMTGLVILLIVTLLVVNRYSSRLVWKVFYDTIEKINRYDLNTHEEFTLQDSDVKEFADLNRVLITMTERIRNDYLNLKEYTENASHEIQTPLAIINSKLELLLQSGDMSEKQYKALADAYEASIRLSKYNSTLILLAKIENKQFPEYKDVSPELIVNSLLENLEDLIRSKKLEVVKLLHHDVMIRMNPYLAEMLIVNLVKNAVRHNVKGGKLVVELGEKFLRISNTGPDHPVDKNLLFKRFY
ncbi:MAG: HAMP domain-containing histidine kinase, partial [Prolixibacteraceae bacterium]|nr:HAMP domain-containing histidine kinase [Prolixibacteraceae bacterium]